MCHFRQLSLTANDEIGQLHELHPGLDPAYARRAVRESLGLDLLCMWSL